MSNADQKNEVGSSSQLITAGEEASREMFAALEGRAETVIVNQDYESFRTIALLLGRLAAEWRARRICRTSPTAPRRRVALLGRQTAV